MKILAPCIALCVAVGAGLVQSQMWTTVVGAAQAVEEAAVRLAVPGAANEYVSLASSGRTVAAAWAATPPDGDTDIYAAISSDEGRSFTPPVRVGLRASVNGEQPPRVVLVPARSSQAAPDVVVLWAAKAPAGTRLMSARSVDGGRTFATPTTVPGTVARGNRGWQSVAVDRAGRPIVVWLDHRDGATARTAAAGHHHGDTPSTTTAADESVARAATSRLYVGSADGSLPTQALVHGVCYCCKTAIAVSPTGDIVTAWRHVYQGGFRDIAFSRSGDGGRTFSAPARVNQDGWQIAGCPEDGPAVAVDATGRSHIVWPTLIRENGRETMALFHAATKDGQTFSTRTRVPAGDAAFHPQLAIGQNGDVFVAWDEGSAGTRRVRLLKGTVSDSTSGTSRTLGTSGTDRTNPVLVFPAPSPNQSRSGFEAPGTHPAVAVTPAGAVVAWTGRSGGRSEIRVATYP